MFDDLLGFANKSQNVAVIESGEIFQVTSIRGNWLQVQIPSISGLNCENAMYGEPKRVRIRVCVCVCE